MPASSRDVVEHLGITYRQLDYAARAGYIPETAKGSGSRRRFDRDTVLRLAVARMVADAMPLGSSHYTAVWTSILRTVIAGPPPPERGVAVLDFAGVHYIAEHEAITPALIEVGALVVRYAVDTTSPLFTP